MKQLRCPKCNSAIDVEVVSILKKKYQILNQVDPKELMPIVEGKDPSPTFNVALPVDVPIRIIHILKCSGVKCGEVFKDAATSIYVDSIWQNVELGNFKAELFNFGLDSKKSIQLRLNYRPKEPV